MATPPAPVPIAKKKDKTPQELVGDFWDKYFSKKPGKVTSIFPRSLYKTLLPAGLDEDPRLQDPNGDNQSYGAHSARNAAESYAAAAKECRERVKRIVQECNRTNEKFTDPDFDIESDMFNNCLNGLVRDYWYGGGGGSGDGADTSVSATELKSSLDTLVNSRVLGADSAALMDVGQVRNFINDSDPWAALFGLFNAHAARGRRAARLGKGQGKGGAQGQGQSKRQTKGDADGAAGADPSEDAKRSKKGVMGGEYYYPGSVHRVDWIFESPQFTVDGYSSSDIMQGGDGDCWWLAAVATIAHRKDLMERVCVARDEEVGVYGFVFQRDGEWVVTVVDDNLYLIHEDFDYYGDVYDSTGKRAREHRKRHQTGSEALYFAKCADKNETWLPLLEKAYAKVHGDYEAISGGWCGEAVEDMTGGVTTTVATNRVLRKDKLWKELVNAEGEFVFALSALGTGWDWTKGGLALGHAYSVLKATEEVGEDGERVRLVQIRNPWGERASDGIGEWNGPWSDGSKEWTPYWLKKLRHTFGDDGVFWMSYQDMLDTFLYLHRTRLFDDKWTVVQQWTCLNVGWVSGYLNTKFVVDVKKAGKQIIVLTQLDSRFFVGLEGQYDFALHFVLQAEGSKPGEHICRVRPVHTWENRSVSCEVELEPGRYEVVPKIAATREERNKLVEDVVREWADKNPQKLRQVGISYDLAHAKGGIPDEDNMLVEKKAKEKAKADAKKRKAKEKAKRKKEKAKREKAKAKAKAKELEVTVTVTQGDKTAVDAKVEAKTEDKGKDKEEKKDEEKKDEEKKDEEKKEEEKKDEAAKPAEEEKKPELKRVGTASAKLGLQRTGTKRELDAGSSSKSEEKKDDEKKDDEKKEEEKKGGEEEKKDDKDDKKADDDDDDDDSDDSDSDSEDEEKKDETPSDDADNDKMPWNAVCVVGLRVYSEDTNTTIELVKPKDPEEGANLTVEAQPAGATM